jgi:hypothetical protein
LSKKFKDHDTKYCNLQLEILYMVYINLLTMIQQWVILNTLFFIKLGIILEYWKMNNVGDQFNHYQSSKNENVTYI